jgi:hypothetical protein
MFFCDIAKNWKCNMKNIIAGLLLSLGLVSVSNAEVCTMENNSSGNIVLILDRGLIGYKYSPDGSMLSLNWAYLEDTDRVFLKFSDGDVRIYGGSKFTCYKKSDKNNL